MRRDEELAKKWLENQGLSVEECRNDPPDFIADGQYAVEVTRLELHTDYKDSGRGEQRGLYNSETKLDEYVKGALEKIGSPGNNKTCFVRYNFDIASRRLPKAKIIQKEIKKALLPLTEPFQCDAIKGKIFKLECGIHLEVIQSDSAIISAKFELGGGPTLSGWYEEDMYNNIEWAISHKENKIACKIDSFCEWWLILIDFISGPRRYRESAIKILRKIAFNPPWCRVIVVSRHECGQWFELKGSDPC